MKKIYIVLAVIFITILPILSFGQSLISKLIQGKTQEEAINIVALETEKNTTQIEENKVEQEKAIDEVELKIENNATQIVETKKEVEEVKSNIKEIDKQIKEIATTTVSTPISKVVLTGNKTEDLYNLSSALESSMTGVSLSQIKCKSIVRQLNSSIKYYKKYEYSDEDTTFDKFDELYSLCNARIKEAEDYLKTAVVSTAAASGYVISNKVLKDNNKMLVGIQNLEKEYRSLNCI